MCPHNVSFAYRISCPEQCAGMLVGKHTRCAQVTAYATLYICKQLLWICQFKEVFTANHVFVLEQVAWGQRSDKFTKIVGPSAMQLLY